MQILTQDQVGSIQIARKNMTLTQFGQDLREALDKLEVNCAVSLSSEEWAKENGSPKGPSQLVSRLFSKKFNKKKFTTQRVVTGGWVIIRVR